MNSELAKIEPTPVILDNKDEICLILMTVLSSLTGLVLSGDVWVLACMKAVDECSNLGIPEDKVKEVIGKFLKFRSDKAKQNPFSSMF